MSKSEKIVTVVMVVALAILLILAFSREAHAQGTVSIRWRWTKPVAGSEPVAYEGDIQFYTEGQDTFSLVWSQATTDTTFTYNGYIPGTYIRARARAKDANDRLGPYGLWSEWFILTGPWLPGQMAVIEVGGEPVE